MVGNEQVRPLAPTTTDCDVASHSKKLLRRRRRFIKCCAYISALIVVLAVVVVVLIFTVFRVKDPIIRTNKIAITKLELVNNTIPKPGSNITITADVSVKNPNVASFRYSKTSTTLYYHDTVVGEAHGPPGQSKARRTSRMNITVDIIADRILANPNLPADFGSGLIGMDSYSRIPGRVKILNIINKHVVVKMNCTITFNVSSRAIQQQDCKRKVDL